MPIKITINGEEILAEKIEISEYQIKVTPFQGTQLKGKIEMDFEAFEKLRDEVIQWCETVASTTQ